MWSWVAQEGAARTWPAGCALALACLTRYEAWPITAAALSLAVGALVNGGATLRYAGRKVAAVAVYPALVIIAFMVLSRLTVGSWLVTSGFFEIDQSLYHRPSAVLEAVWLGVQRINGPVMTFLGIIGLSVVLGSIVRRRDLHHLLVVLSLAACVALPLYAFWNGHPFRIRYMVPLTMSLAVFAGLGVGLLTRYRALASGIVVLTALIETPPLSGNSPMLIEASRDAARVVARQTVTECLLRKYDQTPILASMGSLAPYMQETARVGLSIRQYLHEGIGQPWAESLVEAGRHAGWVLIDEEAGARDLLARHRKSSPEFLAAFDRQCDGGGVALYQRRETP
jgi:hypothetical protein